MSYLRCLCSVTQVLMVWERQLTTPSAQQQKSKELILFWLNSLRLRQFSYSFRLVQAQLKAAGMPSASGWDSLFEKYQALKYSEIDCTLYLNTVIEIYKNSLISSNAAIWLYEAPVESISAISTWAQKLINKKSVFAKTFPHPVEDEELNLAPFNGEFINFETLSNGDLVFYSCAKRAFRHRESIEVDQLEVPARKALIGYDEVFGIKSGFTQAYDRVVVRIESGLMELHIDMCCPLAADDLHQIQVYYTEKFKVFLKSLTCSFLWLNQSKNLFPKITELYNAVDGQIIALGHSTSTKSIKEERMRNRRQDLRVETFHREGINAIPSTDLYSIKKGWTMSGWSHVPAVLIPGKASSAGAVGSSVRHALIEACATPEDFEFVVQKLL